MQKKIRVLIVDDSLLIRTMFTQMLSHYADIEVVGAAVDPFDAREKIKSLNPDVVTLDVEMPKMDGITFLEKIMTLRPMPVIMVSTLTARGADITIRALEIGAVDFITKPTVTNDAELLAIGSQLVEKIRQASMSRLAARSIEHGDEKMLELRGATRMRMIAIGASTGGVEALRDVLRRLPNTMPPMVVTQHMPAGFTKSFASRLDTICASKVHEVQHQQPLLPGNIYIAPGDFHFTVEAMEGGFRARIADGETVSGHKPSVDVLFASVAKQVGKNAVGVILTGMGRDGAQGLLSMRHAGATTIGQAEHSCVVYGMPKVAKQLGAVEHECRLPAIAQAIIDACGHTKGVRNAS
jgi:two-component system chemotaxis response regulator CheB